MAGALRGDRLYVNLSAAQTRQRLAGRGLGVRKVHSAGRGQAVVIHTATGEHLEDLRRLFADVGSSLTEQELGDPVETLPNLGAATARWLGEAGIHTVEELRRIGAVAAFEQVRRIQPEVSLQLLWSLAAALEGRDGNDLSDAEKNDLKSRLSR